MSFGYLETINFCFWDAGAMDRLSFVWEFFKLHADQRLRSFNFYIIIIAVLTASVVKLYSIKGEGNSFELVILGAFYIFFSCIFLMIDERERMFLKMTEKIIIEIEKDSESKIDDNKRLFCIEKQETKTKRKEFFLFFIPKFLTYSKSFKCIFGFSCLLGIMCILTGLSIFEL